MDELLREAKKSNFPEIKKYINNLVSKSFFWAVLKNRKGQAVNPATEEGQKEMTKEIVKAVEEKGIKEEVVSEKIDDIFSRIQMLRGDKPKHQWKGTKLQIENPDGSFDGGTDLKGDPGENAVTPVKGKDYFTKDEQEDFLKKATPVKGKHYRDGIDGNTPVKGIDYFDGEDGKTPIKGVDYEDGKDGSPDTPTQIREKLETLTGEDRLDAKAIKNLPEFIKEKGPLFFNKAVKRLASLLDVNISSPSNGQVLKYNSTTGKWENGVGGGGASAFTDLTDVPSDYTGDGEKFVKVKATEDGLEFVAGTGSAVAWGDITGDLSDQTDLQDELDDKADDSAVVHISGNETITGQKTFSDTAYINNDISLNFKANSGNANSFKTGTDNTFLFDIGAGNSVKIKGGDDAGAEFFGYTDTSFNYVWKTDTLGNATAKSQILSDLTASELVASDGSKKLVSLPVSTYPSLTELSYIKGLTSAIQTQIDGKVSDTGDTMTGLLTIGLAGNALIARNSSDSASVQVAIFEGDRATMAANDQAYITMRLSDSAGNQDEFARMTWRGTDVTSGTEDARLAWSLIENAVLTDELFLTASELSPASSAGLNLGSTTLPWSNAFFASGAGLNWANGDVTVTHTTNLLSWAGASNGYSFDALLRPSTNDVAALGSGTLAWSDLFLASGGIMNFGNGDLTLTHTSGGILSLVGTLGISNGNYIRPSASAGVVMYIGARDVDGATNVPFITLTSDNTPTCDLSTAVTIEGNPLVSTTRTQTLTNKRITKRTGTTTSSATPTINTDNVDFYSLTAQAADITSFTSNLSGTPTEGQTLWIAITGTAARAITWGASFEASTVALPTTTVTTARLDVGFIWNTVTSKWRCVAVA